ncbi:conserved hypothetical protein [Paraburkholderia ribeironis]|uniref:Uncharacterized protein n=1 Tax=Paraburkholderia ribeironis TaxID=1247936 RepID=A0A1N7S0Y4_9BURK|nr:hypothetical protein [Paraburkholderia ribeironis]SIT40637.1 conserved hypothetical protein [Paraburkholderia ribeironis]
MTERRDTKSPLALQARETIEAKLVILRLWIDAGIPWVRNDEGRCICDENDELQLDYFPKDMQGLSQWMHESQCRYTLQKHPTILNFRSFSRGTLDAPHNSTLKEEIRSLFAAIERTASGQLDKTRSRQAIADARSDGEQKQNFINVLEREILKYREEARIANEDRKAAQALQARQKEDYEDKIQKLNNLLREVRNRRPNVVPLDKRTSSDTPSLGDGEKK